jgi:uncharacterized coiled-coil protein SlyX
MEIVHYDSFSLVKMEPAWSNQELTFNFTELWPQIEQMSNELFQLRNIVLARPTAPYRLPDMSLEERMTRLEHTVQRLCQRTRQTRGVR